jgi:hypothetical protein
MDVDMTRTEHLLWILAEECAEVAQRASKAARFGVGEIQPGQPLTNGQRIEYELHDLIAVTEMLLNEGVLPPAQASERCLQVIAKKTKIEKFLRYSEECGTLDKKADDLEIRLRVLTELADKARCQFESDNGPSYDLSKPLDKAMSELFQGTLSQGMFGD